MRVVELVGVTERAVDEGRLIRREAIAVVHEARRARAAQPDDRVSIRAAPRKRRARDLAGELVEQHPLGLLDDLRCEPLAPNGERRQSCRRTCVKHAVRVPTTLNERPGEGTYSDYGNIGSNL